MNGENTALDTNSLRAAVGTVCDAALMMQDLATDVKNGALGAMAAALRANVPSILAANEADCAAAAGLPSSLAKRLEVNADKIERMAAGLESVIALADPVGIVEERIELDEGLILERISCPLGVLAIIFESRPDVVAQVMGLAVKSGNGVIFKGGSEAVRSNRILYDVLYAAGLAAGLPANFARLVETREEIKALLDMDDLIDLVIPRGSNALVRSIMDSTRIPVLGHADGICHMYLHPAADPAMAVRLVHDAKIQYPAVCNAIENLLVDKAIADRLLPLVAADLEAGGVELRGDAAACRIVPSLALATAEDWDTEYNDLILSIAVVDGLDEAIAFINRHGSGHSDAIVTADPEAMKKFSARVDSSSVMINASTRFADGFVYGKGAEIGISTNKTHARGPVGLEGLVIYKYHLRGAGHCIADYSGPVARKFRHRRLVGPGSP